MSEQRRSAGMFASLAAGVIIGAVEAVLAIAFAAFVFGGLLVSRLADGIGLYLVAAALTLGILAWRAGRRGVVGSVQDAAAAVLAVVASTTAAKAADIAKVAQATGLKDYEKPDVFLTVIAATLVVTVLCGVVFWRSGRSGSATWSASSRTRSWAGSSPAPDGSCSRAASTSRRASRSTCAPSDSWLHSEALKHCADRARVRPDPALRRPVREEAAGHPDRAGHRARGVRDRHARHGLLARHREGRRMAPRAVRVGPAVATVDVPRARRRRLVGGARAMGRDRHRRARRGHRDPVQHQRVRDRAAPGPRHEPGAPRRRRPQRRSPARSAASPATTRSA